MKKAVMVGVALVAVFIARVVSADYAKENKLKSPPFKYIALQRGTNTLTVINVAKKNVVVYYTLREPREDRPRHFEKELEPGEKLTFNTLQYALINIDAERLIP